MSGLQDGRGDAGVTPKRVCEFCRFFRPAVVPSEGRCGALDADPDETCYPTDSCFGWEAKED